MQNRKEFIDNFFRHLNDAKVDFLIPRKIDLVYDTNIKDDIDVIIKTESMKSFIKSSKRFGFVLKKDTHILNSFLYGAKPHYHFLNFKEEVHIDVVQKWQHKSIDFDRCGRRKINKWLPVHNELQIEIWRSATQHNRISWARVPSKEIELCHIMCHVLLDKETISAYYKERIEYLIRICDQKKLLNYLELVFYKFSKRYIDICLLSDFDNIHNEYISFDKY